jgi:hypothetical protein
MNGVRPGRQRARECTLDRSGRPRVSSGISKCLTPEWTIRLVETDETSRWEVTAAASTPTAADGE